MHTLDSIEAQKILQAIEGPSPTIASEAEALRRKWLLESELGVLHIPPAVRALLDRD